MPIPFDEFSSEQDPQWIRLGRVYKARHVHSATFPTPVNASSLAAFGMARGEGDELYEIVFDHRLASRGEIASWCGRRDLEVRRISLYYTPSCLSHLPV